MDHEGKYYIAGFSYMVACKPISKINLLQANALVISSYGDIETEREEFSFQLVGIFIIQEFFFLLI